MGDVADTGICKDIKERSGKRRLEIEEICTFYGEAQAQKSVSLDVRDKEVVAVLGSNGAG